MVVQRDCNGELERKCLNNFLVEIGRPYYYRPRVSFCRAEGNGSCILIELSQYRSVKKTAFIIVFRRFLNDFPNYRRVSRLLKRL